jgi:hypothetical protein
MLCLARKRFISLSHNILESVKYFDNESTINFFLFFGACKKRFSSKSISEKKMFHTIESTGNNNKRLIENEEDLFDHRIEMIDGV